MPTSIDINATFNPIGDIKPMYVRLEDEHHQLHTYKIQSIDQTKDDRYSDISSRLFYCNILVDDTMKKLLIRYHFQSHKWSLIEQ
jgi:hypothetical protein